MRTTLCLLIPLLTGALRLMSPSGYKPKEPIIRGSTPPFENFDPFQFSKDEKRAVFFREAELKHGRIAMIAASIVSIYDAESVYPAEESTPKELIDFIESLNKGQFAKLQEFFNEFPRLREEVKFTCTKCGTENKVVLEGLNDFFA